MRPATAADAADLYGMVVELAAYERLSHRMTATESDIAEHLFGPRPAAEALVAECGSKVAGFALYFRTFSTFLGRPGLYLEDLYVRPAYRGRGAARALMIHVARLGVTEGCGRFEWAVLDWNTPAIGFYRALGAEPLEDWTTQRVTGEALLRLARQALPGE